jgi:nucleoid-associated protein YgaU
MRNDVKLGLAVGGLLLGVVLAYALFFSNTNKDRKELADGGVSALGNNSDASAQKPAPANTDQTATDSNPPTGAQPPATTDHPQSPVADAANPLIGKSWQLLLNEGATANSAGAITPPVDHSANTGVIRTPTPPSRDATTPNTTTTLAEPPPAATGPRRYTIKHGDTYWSIAKAEYGNSAYWSHIQRANPTIDPGRIKAGDSIILPDKNEVVAPATATTKQPSAADLIVDPAKQYRVQSGDNLNTISKKLYGRYDKWTQIYDLNKDLIGPNPAALKKDMILALPEPPIRIAGTIQ